MKHIAAIVTMVFICAFATEALAQPRAEAKGPPAAAKQRLQKIRARVLRRKVGLSDEKAKKVEEIFRKHNSAQKKAQKQMREGQKELRRLFRADSDDQKAYDAALTKMHKAQRATQKMRDKQFGALKKVLTPKEQAKLLRAMRKVQQHMRRARAGRRPQGNRNPAGRRGGGRRGPPGRRPPPRR